MSFTEQELRESLRSATAAPPQAPDRVALVATAVRRRRRRLVVATAVAVVLALVAVPVVRLLPDRLRHNAIPAGTTPAQVDAMMKYATFVAAWSGDLYGVRGTDPDVGVVGVHARWNLPPFNCVEATVDADGPQGSQHGWILAAPSVIQGSSGLPAGAVQIIEPVVAWPVGGTVCDPATPPTMVAAAPDSNAAGLLSWPLVFAQATTDPSRPALDVEAVYRSIPQELVTDAGRAAFAAYERLRPTTYGSDREQLDRVLTAVGGWVSVALSRGLLDTPSPVTGPRTLTADTYVGSVDVPAGYAARWDVTTGAFCVQGSVGTSGVRHFTDQQFGDPGTPSEAALDGPCR